MGNGVRKNAIAQNGANAGVAASTENLLNPIYSQLATGTVGYTPQQKADMLTSASQTGGGGVASAVGQGGLMAARTGNAGAADAALDAAAQQAGRQQSQTGLQVATQDANVAEQNRQTGLAGLNDIYRTSTGAAVGDLNAANNAGPSFWKQILAQGLKSGGDAGVAWAGNQ